MHGKRGGILLTVIVSVICAFATIILVGFFISSCIVKKNNMINTNTDTGHEVMSSKIDDNRSTQNASEIKNASANSKPAVNYIDYLVSDLLFDFNNVYNTNQYFQEFGYIYNNDVIPHIKFQVKFISDGVLVNNSKVQAIVVEKGGCLLDGFYIGDKFNNEYLKNRSYKTEYVNEDEYMLSVDTPTYNIKVNFDSKTNESLNAVISIK